MIIIRLRRGKCRRWISWIWMPQDVPYWHTAQDTMDKISAKTLAIVGHVILESVKELQTR